MASFGLASMSSLSNVRLYDHGILEDGLITYQDVQASKVELHESQVVFALLQSLSLMNVGIHLELSSLIKRSFGPSFCSRLSGAIRLFMPRSMSSRQSWAKLLCSLTVNSLSYFVKTNY
jgi:hypothetical protein